MANNILQSKMGVKNWMEIVANALVAILFFWFLYNAYYELFVNVPEVHYPRIILDSDNWGRTTVDFTLNTPTVTNCIILIFSSICLLVCIVLFFRGFFKPEARTKKYWLILAVGFIICVVAAFVSFYDFITTAFDGVG